MRARRLHIRETDIKRDVTKHIANFCIDGLCDFAASLCCRLEVRRLLTGGLGRQFLLAWMPDIQLLLAGCLRGVQCLLAGCFNVLSTIQSYSN